MEITKDLDAILKKHLSEFEARIERSFKIQLESSIAGLKEEFNGLLTTKLSEVDAKLLAIEKSQQFLGAQYETFRNQVGNVLKKIRIFARRTKSWQVVCGSLRKRIKLEQNLLMISSSMVAAK